jgi:hypothetical protein
MLPRRRFELALIVHRVAPRGTIYSEKKIPSDITVPLGGTTAWPICESIWKRLPAAEHTQQPLPA